MRLKTCPSAGIVKELQQYLMAWHAGVFMHGSVIIARFHSSYCSHSRPLRARLHNPNALAFPCAGQRPPCAVEGHSGCPEDDQSLQQRRDQPGGLPGGDGWAGHEPSQFGELSIVACPQRFLMSLLAACTPLDDQVLATGIGLSWECSVGLYGGQVTRNNVLGCWRA